MFSGRQGLYTQQGIRAGFCVLIERLNAKKLAGSLLNNWSLSKNQGSISLAIWLLGLAKLQESIAN